MPVLTTRHLQPLETKSLFDELIDGHAEAYLNAYPEVKEFSFFQKSGTPNYYIGMVWTNDTERPDKSQLKIRGSRTFSEKNEIVRLDLSVIASQDFSLFPGQIIAFQAQPFVKDYLTVKQFLDPAKITRPFETINTKDKVNLLVASGPYMNSEQNDWTLFNKLIESVRSNNVTHAILLGPFVDSKNKSTRAHFDSNWKLVFDRIIEELYEHACDIYLVPSSRDVLPHFVSTNHMSPMDRVDFKLNLKSGVKPACLIHTVTDPARIDLSGIAVEVSASEVLAHLNKCIYLNKDPTNRWILMYKQLAVHGIYPIFPPSHDIAMDYPKLYKHLPVDRYRPHMLILPSNFNTSVNNVDDCLIVTLQKCCLKRQAVLIEIPKIESTDEASIESLAQVEPKHTVTEIGY